MKFRRSKISRISGEIRGPWLVILSEACRHVSFHILHKSRYSDEPNIGSYVCWATDVIKQTGNIECM